MQFAAFMSSLQWNLSLMEAQTNHRLSLIIRISLAQAAS